MATPRGSLSNNLLGKHVRPLYGHVWFDDACVPHGQPLPNQDAVITAAFLQDGDVKVMCRRGDGICKAFFLQHLRLMEE